MGEGDKGVQIMHKEVLALIAQAKGQTDQAITLLTEATTIEESMRAPNGAADPIKPSHELLGEVLLAAGKHKEAADAFEASLLRMPNRARSLMGAIKAHAGAGNKLRAAERQATFNSFWKGKPFVGTTTEAR
jgi:predicted negative regulator of RcsB-dependent stress response